MVINKGTKIENTQINKVYSELEKKINYTDALSLEEIQATTNLTGKVASASALINKSNINYHVRGDSLSIKITKNAFVAIAGSGNDFYYFGVSTPYGINKLSSDGVFDSDIDVSNGYLILPTNYYYYYAILF